MGAGTSKKSQVTPGVAHISVRPRDVALDQSLQSQSSGNHGGSDDTLKKDQSRTSTSRQSSHSSGQRPTAGGLRRGSMSGGGALSRPLSTISGRQWSGKGYRKRSGGVERLRSPTTGLPFHRDLDNNADLSMSQRSQRLRTVGHLFQQEMNSPENDVIFLRIDPELPPDYPASCCQLCGNRFTNLGIRMPLLLLCGHTYCSSCLEKACESYDYPTALKCGICLIVTPLDQLNPKQLPQNEAILDLVSSKEYNTICSEKNPESCAECEHRTASLYCSECSASFCDICGKKAHQGSRVRSRHKPVPINLKPRPQPTCKKHPGQSCVLYCETEKQPMCVLCKFYNQHKFHKFELMSKVATHYNTTVLEKLKQLDQLERELDEAAKSLYNTVSDINTSANRVQERLERHFTEMKKSYLAALERREAMLLSLVDRQVDIKQEILAEMRLEVAAARARVLAAHEEASKLTNLHPITALLSRRHMDLSFDRALRQTITSPHSDIQPDVPLSLLPEITSGLVQTLNQHGAILQLPPKPQFNGIEVTKKTISLKWDAQDQNLDVCSDRTLTFSLHCYGDIPHKQTKLTFKKRLRKLVTPESGFEDMSEMSSESKSTFPSLPPSLLGSRNISIVTQKDQDTNRDRAQVIKEEMGEYDFESQATRDNNIRNVTSFLPEPIRLPKRREDSKLPQLVTQSTNTSLNIPNPLRLAAIQDSSSNETNSSSRILNLPPLIVSKPGGEQGLQVASMQSMTTSGVFEDSEEDGNSGHMSTVDESEQSDQPKSNHADSCSSSLSELSTSNEVKVEEYSDLGRFCRGYAFEEIYCGEDTSFLYSGVVTGASYFFRVRCHNAAGWGPWSDTAKCMTTLHKH